MCSGYYLFLKWYMYTFHLDLAFWLDLRHFSFACFILDAILFIGSNASIYLFSLRRALVSWMHFCKHAPGLSSTSTWLLILTGLTFLRFRKIPISAPPILSYWVGLWILPCLHSHLTTFILAEFFNLFFLEAKYYSRCGKLLLRLHSSPHGPSGAFSSCLLQASKGRSCVWKIDFPIILLLANRVFGTSSFLLLSFFHSFL